MKEKVKALLAANPKITLAKIGEELGLAREIEVIENLPASHCKEVGGDKFEEILNDIGTWGEVLFIKNTPAFIIEFKTNIPSGKKMQGYYNFNHKESKFGGHLKFEEIDRIFFVSQTFMGLLSLSVQFYDKEGNNIFKLSVGRDAKMKLLPEQVEKFDSLKARI
ncbi:heme utilization cystosolic carrier protein HutX [Campylobacter sp. 9BO]|uniref:heme utilization cystosolic carrier protein HutX n=1 Tax=Campylobacter sp. 9BO TaxID=3424759 RepID=UPI003D33E69B